MEQRIQMSGIWGFKSWQEIDSFLLDGFGIRLGDSEIHWMDQEIAKDYEDNDLI